MRIIAIDFHRAAISILPHTRICTYTAGEKTARGERKCKLREFRLLLCKSTFRPHPPKITRPSDYEIMARTDRIYEEPAKGLSRDITFVVSRKLFVPVAGGAARTEKKID